MGVRRAFPIVTTHDLTRLVAFYRAAFDARQTYAFPDDGGDVLYVTLAIGYSELGVGFEEGPARGHAGASLWLYVDDVDESYRRALSAGAESVRGPAAMPWGERVAQVRDPDGLEINLGQEP
ncbi:glyoxalase/bleomycin resistance/extradiol dioxygenase family protein [Demequina sp. NBRC 110053]|uniref:VOC family protein n=1 Tax=Demequina sp. NBRC 110053 TaxID=1570342 RepID=UPI000A0787E6|nr:VOC family protein [Demequina sp. NBRC 110053]